MSHTSVIDINRVNVGGHFTHLILTHHLSYSNWFELLGGSFISHVGKRDEEEVTVVAVVVVAIVVVVTTVVVVVAAVAIVAAAVAAIVAGVVAVAVVVVGAAAVEATLTFLGLTLS